MAVSPKRFAELKEGNETQQVCEITPLTTDKYCELAEDGDSKFDMEKGEFVPRHYDAIRFTKGYGRSIERLLVKVVDSRIILFVDENNKPIEYEYKGDWYLAAQIEFTLGEIIPDTNIN